MRIELEKIQLRNFKCFSNHTVYFNNITVAVGQNNAGKTTMIEALRILGLATARFKNAVSYSNRPEHLSEYLPLAIKGIKVSAKAIDIDLERVFYRYGGPPAIVSGYFSNEVYIKVFVYSETELFAVFYFKGKNISSKSKVNSIGVPDVRVLPQITPLQKKEQYVTKETLQKNKFSKRTSGNFKNSLWWNKNTAEFHHLEEMISATWNRMKIDGVFKDANNNIFLNLRDGDYVTEIFFMGHGIQIWLQTLWFIVSSPKEAIIVLDEPDVYMHADLQRKLVRMLKGSYNQIIIATHSVEIMSEVFPENILIINRNLDESVLADNYPVLQSLISGMGSIHNISLSRLLNNHRYLYLEGNDMDILKVFYDILFSEDTEPLDHFPHMTTGGWGGWTLQKESAKQLVKEMPDLKVYFIFDSDYHCKEDIDNRYKEAQANGLSMHIWNRKEIENYILVNTAIARFISKKQPQYDYEDLCAEIANIIREICECQKQHIVDKIGDELCKKDRKKEASQHFTHAREIVESTWNDYQGIISKIPGKEVLKALSEQCKQKYNVSFSAQQIASVMTKEEISDEIFEVLEKIKDGVKIDS